MVMLIHSFGETRETRVQVYTEDIQEWNDTKRDEFANNDIKIQPVYSNETVGDLSSSLQAQTQETYEHQIFEDKYGDLPSYEPYYYKLHDQASSFGIQTIDSFNAYDTIKFNIVIQDGSSQQTVSLPSFALYDIQKYHMANIGGCNRLRGHFEESGRLCYVYHIVKSMCVQIDKDDGGNWYINRNENTGEFGCYSSKQNATDYEIIPLESGQQIDDKFPYTINNVTWIVRSAYDPWLIAVVLTEDTNKFGMTSFELRFLGLGLLF